ncbi:MAG: hypothetical protein U0R80_13735 [Nocardioidaceae bacterium]
MPPRLLNVVHVLLVLAGLGALGASAAGYGPVWLDGAGAVAIGTTYVWILAARTGGRVAVFTPLALGLGIVTLVLDNDVLRSGTAVMTSAVGAALGVMATVPAVRYVAVVREVMIAVLVSAVGAVAAVGFEPRITLNRFDYTTLAVALVIVLALVYRLGAGFHGLGTRGLVVVVIGGLVLAVALAYGELLRRYGTPGLVHSFLEAADWMRANLGAAPRPLQAALGIPALAWGCHQRARRRQGWWACAFGVTATAPVASVVVDPRLPLSQAGLGELYTLVVGLLLGWVLVRLDLLLTGSRGRGARRAEEASALRPEPRRTEALL